MVMYLIPTQYLKRLHGHYWVSTKPSYGNKEIEDIIGEANIIGITISDAAFGSMSPLQFPGGIKINSTHPRFTPGYSVHLIVPPSRYPPLNVM